MGSIVYGHLRILVYRYKITISWTINLFTFLLLTITGFHCYYNSPAHVSWLVYMIHDCGCCGVHVGKQSITFKTKSNVVYKLVSN